MRAHKIFRMSVFLAGLALMNQNASATIFAVLQGPGVVSSGSTITFDLSSSFDTNSLGSIDQYRFDFGDGSTPTGWMGTPFVSHTFIGTEGTLYDVLGYVRWSGSVNEVGIASQFVKVTNSGQIVASPVPEPETDAMLLAGLGLLGFIAQRRKQYLSA